VLRWADENLLELKREEIGEYYGRYRLHVPEAEHAMARSLERYGQLSPVVVCRRLDRYELIDGFKRLSAARGMPQLPHLSARLMKPTSGRPRPPSTASIAPEGARANWKKHGSFRRWCAKTA